jgi:site-specific DNA recombinase
MRETHRKRFSRRGEPPVRCAIYTRKSSEEGLEQEFNSLHAQREACEAFILSQKHEGWGAVADRYDDGAFSGGSMERPALQRLLENIEAGLIDIVVVYKVDRLTRSLADFAKMVEIFDRHGVSFVSVTQQFNTTTSMGRLTLNVLLSFAQFEREVTGERIRDKIAASKKKGMWMGGFVPLGYQAKDRSLVVDESEAETVWTLFSLYLDLGNVRLVKEAADRLGLTTKRRLTSTGRSHGGCRFSRGAIYKILSNPVYVGEIVHKAERHPGAHLPIIDRETWDKVQSRLADNATRQKAQVTAASPSLLAGLIFDETGQPLTPTHANKQGRRYRYYVSQALVNGDQRSAKNDRPGSWRLPASAIEELIVNGLCDLLLHPAHLTDQLPLNAFTADQLEAILAGARQLGNAIRQACGTDRTLIRKLVHRIIIASDSIKMDLDRPALLSAIVPHKSWADDVGACQGRLSLTIAVTLKRRGSELKLVLCDRPQPVLDQVLISNLARGYAWLDELKMGAGRSLGAIAEREGISAGLVRRYLDLALLPTDILESIIAGQQPIGLTSETVKRCYPLPISWAAQRQMLGCG